MQRLYGIVGVAWILVCLYFVFQGGNKNRKASFEKVPIIMGIAVALVLGIAMIFGAFFYPINYK